MIAAGRIEHEKPDDLELARRLGARDTAAVRLIVGRNNQLLFRAAWSILKSRSEAEDAVQSGYLRAFAAIDTFEGRSSLSTWLTRIVINEALGRRRATKRRLAHLNEDKVAVLDEYREKLMRGSMTSTSPDTNVAREQIRLMLEEAIGRLPDTFRLVFVLREVEGLSVEETAETLGIPPATVKTRLFRARRQLRQELAPDLKTALSGTFPFAGADCEGMTERVLTAFCA